MYERGLPPGDFPHPGGLRPGPAFALVTWNAGSPAQRGAHRPATAAPGRGGDRARVRALPAAPPGVHRRRPPAARPPRHLRHPRRAGGLRADGELHRAGCAARRRARPAVRAGAGVEPPPLPLPPALRGAHLPLAHVERLHHPAHRRGRPLLRNRVLSVDNARYLARDAARRPASSLTPRLSPPYSKLRPRPTYRFTPQNVRGSSHQKREPPARRNFDERDMSPRDADAILPALALAGVGARAAAGVEQRGTRLR